MREKYAPIVSKAILADLGSRFDLASRIAITKKVTLQIDATNRYKGMPHRFPRSKSGILSWCVAALSQAELRLGASVYRLLECWSVPRLNTLVDVILTM